MTVLEAITHLDQLKPNGIDSATKYRWLSDIEGILYDEVFSGTNGDYEGRSLPYTAADDDVVLCVPEPYADVYVKYLFAQIDFINGEFTRYNNSMVMFNVAYAAFAHSVTRGFMPTQPNGIVV